MQEPDTQFDIELTEKADLLLLTARGKYSLLKANHLFKFAVDSSMAQGKGRILIDIADLTGHVSFSDRFQYAAFLSSYIRKNALGKVNKIAVVGKEPIVDKDRFGEIVATNRGANVRVFTDMSEASIWINDK